LYSIERGQDRAGSLLPSLTLYSYKPSEELSPWPYRIESNIPRSVISENFPYFTADGQLVPTPEETALLASRQLEIERQEKERLQAKLRALGIDPD
jgi:hypothetical protein